MGALTPGPEDPEQQDDGADKLANPTHGLKTIPAGALAPPAPARWSDSRPGTDAEAADRARWFPRLAAETRPRGAVSPMTRTGWGR